MDHHELAALRALRDCGVIRASGFHPGYAGLRGKGMAFGTPTLAPDKRDYRLTSKGREIVKFRL
jgi:hypothetical protein